MASDDQGLLGSDIDDGARRAIRGEPPVKEKRCPVRIQREGADVAHQCSLIEGHSKHHAYIDYDSSEETFSSEQPV